MKLSVLNNSMAVVDGELFLMAVSLHLVFLLPIDMQPVF